MNGFSSSSKYIKYYKVHIIILIDSDYIGEATLESAYDLINENSMENERREELAELIEDLM